MRNLPIQLKIVILDTDKASAGVLKAILETKPDVIDVKLFTDVKNANDALRQSNFNGLFIDIFSVGAEKGTDFIGHVRKEYPDVSVCLYSHSSDLTSMPNVSEYWKNKFGHYFKLSKDKTVQGLEREVEGVLSGIAYDVQAFLARDRVSGLRKLAQETPHSLTDEQKREIEETADVVEKALESKGANTQFHSMIIPGVNTSQMEQLVLETLKEASNSLQVTTKVNIGVLATGSLLVIVSFIVAAVTNRWEAVAFGGFGMAGVIASLITNPLKSISISARRLVQVQAAYLGFLSQLAFLGSESEDITIIEKSKRLEETMAQTLKVLDEHFGK